MRGSPQVAADRLVAKAPSFWTESGLTLLFDVGVMTPIILLYNLSQARGFPVDLFRTRTFLQ